MLRSKYRRLAIVMAGTLIAALAAGCTASPSKSSPSESEVTSSPSASASGGESSASGVDLSKIPEDCRIGFANREITADSNREIIEGVREVVEPAGCTLEITDAQGDQTTHNNNIESLINSGVTALEIQLGDPNQMASIVAKAEQGNIPVVTSSVGSLTPGAITDVNGDETLMGTLLARVLLGSIDYNGKVLAFWVPGAPLLETRLRMLEAVAADYPNVEIQRVPTEHSPAKVQSQMEALLAANAPGTIAAVWGAYDQLASGAVQAIQQAGRSDEIKVGGIDFDRASIQMLAGENSPFVVSLVQDAHNIGTTVGEVLLRAITGDDLSDLGVSTFTRTWIVTRHNLVASAEQRYGAGIWEELSLDPAEIASKYVQDQDITVMRPTLTFG